MNHNEITNKIIDSQKKVFAAVLNSVFMLQAQTSGALNNLLKQSPWITVKARSIINEWADIYKKGMMDFQKAVDQNYIKLEEVLMSNHEADKSKSKN